MAAAGLLLGPVDLHAVSHHWQDPGREAPGAEHPASVHLETELGAHELPCFACAVGLKSHGRPAESARSLTAPPCVGRLTAEAAAAHAGRLAYRLPLPRAPPLS